MLIFIYKVVDFKRKKFIEKRNFTEILIEVFGDSFGIDWWLPIKIGGFYKFYCTKILKSSCNYHQTPNQNESNENADSQSDKKND